MKRDFLFALRMIAAHRWFSAAVVVTLALGIGLNTMVFTLVDAVLFKPVAIPGGERLVAIRNSDLVRGKDHRLGISLPDLRDYRAQTSSLEAIEGSTDEEGVLSERGNPPQAYRLQRATSGIFTMMHVPPVLGRGFLPSDDKLGAAPVLLLGYGVWKERYASSPDVIGKQVSVNEKPATIIGVMPAGFKFPAGTDMWMPLLPTAELENRDKRWLQVFAMLKPGVGIKQATVEMNAIAGRMAGQYPITNKDLGVEIQTFHQRYNGGSIRMIFLLMLGAVGFVLLIACANVANMMMSRALGRQREMSIRTALGATRWRVVRQLLIESVLLSAMGGLLGLGLAAAGVHWFDLSTADVGKPYWIQFAMDYTVFGYFALLCILSGLLFGIAPALSASRVELNEVLKDGARSVGQHRGGKLSAVLVVFQFALTLVLLTGAGAFVHSLLQALDTNKLVPADQLTTARIDFPEDRYKDTDSRQHFYDQLLPRIQALPGVTHVAIASNLPGLGSADREIEIEHTVADAKAKRPQVSFVVQSPGYFDAIQLPLLTGRDFNSIDGTAGHKSAVLTRECAEHFWPAQEAIGKRFRLYDDNKPGDWITVVGVSANLVQDMNSNAPNPLLFLPFRQEGWNGMAIAVQSTADPASGMRAAVQNLDANLPLREVSSLTSAVDHHEWFLHLFTRLFSGFALIALLMASVGLYAVMAHATGSRTQEIGVRMALGANTRNILLLVMKRGLWQIAAGLALGLAAAWPVAKAMASLELGITGSDPAIFLLVAAVLASVGLFACWLPARRAAALDPVKAIRYE